MSRAIELILAVIIIGAGVVMVVDWIEMYLRWSRRKRDE